MNPIRHTILGLFFFGTLIGLGVVTIYLGNFNPFAPALRYSVFFEEVNGLRTGDQVHVYGMPQGKVRNIEVTSDSDPRRRLRVELAMDRFLALHEDTEILITDETLLGGKRVDVKVGSGAPLEEGAALYGVIGPGPLHALQQLVSENREPFHRVLENLASITDGLQSGERSLASVILEEAAHGSLNSALGSIASISAKIDAGDGSFSQLLNSGDLHERVRHFLDSAAVVTDRLSTGDGTFARLLNDAELYENLRLSSISVRQILDRVDQGEEGLVARLFSERSSQLYEDLEVGMHNLRVLLDQLNAGSGTLARLVKDEEMGAKVSAIVDELHVTSGALSDILTGVQAGRGIVGYLFSDDQGARDLRHVVDSINAAIEDAREAAPVSSLGSFLFGQF